MKDSKPIYVLHDNDNFYGIVWETELGKIVIIQGKLNINNNLGVYDVETGQEIKDIDLRNVLMSILPQ